MWQTAQSLLIFKRAGVLLTVSFSIIAKKSLHRNTIIYQFPGTVITMFQKLDDLETTEVFVS